MSETEWLVAANHEPLLNFLRGNGSERKLRLLGCAKCRLLRPSLDGVEIAERFADGLVTLEELRATWGVTESMPRSWPEQGYGWAAIMPASPNPNHRELDPAGFDSVVAFRGHFLHALRDIFGNPFRSISVNPTWFTSTVLALATGIYQNRAFDWMPILADALQEAGCENEDILTHCRETSIKHVRGCWVVDLVLGKE